MFHPVSRVAFVGAVVATAAAAATPAQPRLVHDGSEIVFTSRQMGVPVDGRFRRFDAEVVFDPRAPEAASVLLTVDLASASFAAAEVEAEIRKPEWFDTAKATAATFRSSAVRATGANTYEVAGRLTLKGTTRDLVVPVALGRAGGNATASGSFTMKRLDFRIGDGEWRDVSLVADEVRVRFRVVLAGVAPP